MWHVVTDKVFHLITKVLEQARRSCRDETAITALEHEARATAEALKREIENMGTAEQRERDNAIRSDALSRTIATERNNAYGNMEGLHKLLAEMIAMAPKDAPSRRRINEIEREGAQLVKPARDGRW